MDVLATGIPADTEVRRCHLWCWAPATAPPEWEQRTLVVGGLSPLGLLVAGLSAALSASGNARRREAAISDAAPRWRHVANGYVRFDDGLFVVTDTSGLVRTFDVAAATCVDSPQPGWLRVQYPGSLSWAIHVT